jgi:hypothetical protein
MNNLVFIDSSQFRIDTAIYSIESYHNIEEKRLKDIEWLINPPFPYEKIRWFTGGSSKQISWLPRSSYLKWNNLDHLPKHYIR